MNIIAHTHTHTSDAHQSRGPQLTFNGLPLLTPCNHKNQKIASPIKRNNGKRTATTNRQKEVEEGGDRQRKGMTPPQTQNCVV